jgi:outer membrane protein assembly factor BamB
MQRPHFVAISPYDAEKHVWIVDDHKHVIHKFTHDGKTEVQTLGTYGEPGADDKHFNRPTFMDWFPDGSFVVADGYNGTRVVKFDKNGKYLTAWGQKGNPPNDTRPGYFNNVHGIAVDPQTRRVFVNDRGNHRAQVFDENGKFLSEWKFGDPPSDIHLFHIMSDGSLWAADRGTNKILKYDLDGKQVWRTDPPPPVCSWGTRNCISAQSQAVSAIPGVVFSGSQDGHLRAYASANGRVLWDFDTAQSFTTVNGIAAAGGSLDNGGATVANGMVYVNSGYGRITGQPGNLLLAFAVGQ